MYPGSHKIERRVRGASWPNWPKLSLPSKRILCGAGIIAVYTALVLLATLGTETHQEVAMLLASVFSIVLLAQYVRNLPGPSYANTWPIDWRGVDVVGRVWEEAIRTPRLSHQQAVVIAGDLLYIMGELDVCESWQLRLLAMAETSTMLRLAVRLLLFVRHGSWVMLHDWKTRRGVSLVIYCYHARAVGRPTLLYQLHSKLKRVWWLRRRFQALRRAANFQLGLDFLEK